MPGTDKHSASQFPRQVITAAPAPRRPRRGAFRRLGYGATPAEVLAKEGIFIFGPFTLDETVDQLAIYCHPDEDETFVSRLEVRVDLSMDRSSLEVGGGSLGSIIDLSSFSSATVIGGLFLPVNFVCDGRYKFIGLRWWVIDFTPVGLQCCCWLRT